MGGGGSKAPQYQNYNPSQFQGGQPVLNQLLRQFQNPQGLSQGTRDIFEKQGRGSLIGSLNSSKDQLGSSLSAANVPLSERIKGFQGLERNYQSGLNDLYSNIAGQNETAVGANKAQGLSGYLSLLGLAGNKENALNTYGMNKYQTDKENEFSLGKALGGILQTGGQLGGAAISKKR